MTPERWRQIEELYHEALLCPGEGRARFLADACADDAALRHEVEALLTAASAADGYLSTPAFVAMAERSASSLSGQRLGVYQVQELIGAGGMGEVYRARDTTLGRDVAIKILPRVFASDPERRARFAREARMLAALNHPHIGAIYGFEEHAGVPALVLELVEGPTLADRLDQGPVPVTEVLRIATQIAEALDAAHERGIVHRDLKPANIKIGRDGAVKVLDFGLATAVIDLGVPETSHSPTVTFARTREGAVLGTPAYMSPEQARGKPVDKRCDIWAFGCVVYEMLTGRVPFAGETMSDTIVAILERSPDWDLLPADTPQRVRRLLVRSLEKDPRRRLRDVGEARVELDEALREPAGVGADARVARTRVWTWRVLAASGAALAFIAAANVDRLKTALTGAPSVVRIESVAVLPFTNVNADPETEYQSDGLTDRIIDELSQLPSLKVISHRAAFLYKGRDVDPRAVGRELGVEAVLTGRVTARADVVTIDLELVDARDNTHIWGEQYVATAADLIGVHAEIPVDIAGKLWSRVGGDATLRVTRQQTGNAAAYRLYLQGRQAFQRWNQDGSKAAIAYFEQAIAADPNYALAYAGLADTYLFGTNPGVSLDERNRRARAAVTKALALDSGIGEAHASLAQLLTSEDWDFPGGEREFTRAVELSPSSLDVHHMYSHYLLAMGRIDDSLRESQKVIELDPLSPLGLGHLAYHQLYARQYDESIASFQRYLLKEQDDVDAHRQLGDASYQRGMMAQAVEEFLRAAMLSGATPDRIEALRRAYANRGMQGYLQEWVAYLSVGSSTVTTSTTTKTTQVAGAYARLGNRDAAFEWLEKAYAEHNPALVHLREDVVFDNLRGDPRFAVLLRRIGLPPV